MQPYSSVAAGDNDKHEDPRPPLNDRRALLLGCSSGGETPLIHVRHDLEMICRVLEEQVPTADRFQVTVLDDASAAEMQQAIQAFCCSDQRQSASSDDSVRFIYFAGHGCMANGKCWCCFVHLFFSTCLLMRG